MTVRILIVAAPEEKASVRALCNHLAPAVRSGQLTISATTDLAPGAHRNATIRACIDTSQTIVLLLTAELIASRDGYSLLEQAVASRANVIPVLLRACDWEHSPVGSLQVSPRDGVPIGSQADGDAAWLEVAIDIRNASGARTATDVTSNERAAIAVKLEGAQTRKRRLAEKGLPTDGVDVDILQLRRHMRQGAQLRPGDTLGDDRYTLLEVLGKGGFATVWKAHDDVTATEVAIKILHSHLSRDELRRERFFRGARVMKKLDHPHIVHVLDPDGHERGFDYFVMELMAGGTLRDAVIENRVSSNRILPILERICDALIAAHSAGLIHRDIKPANILFDDQQSPRLSDFDLVAAADTTGGTRTGALGTFVYAAPELMERPQDADPTADVYGLGMTAIFCWLGRDLPQAILRTPDKVVSGLACSEDLKSVLLRSIAWEKEDRFPDMSAFCEALRGTRADMYTRGPQREPLVTPHTAAPAPDAAQAPRPHHSSPTPAPQLQGEAEASVSTDEAVEISIEEPADEAVEILIEEPADEAVEISIEESAHSPELHILPLGGPPSASAPSHLATALPRSPLTDDPPHGQGRPSWWAPSLVLLSAAALFAGVALMSTGVATAFSRVTLSSMPALGFIAILGSSVVLTSIYALWLRNEVFASRPVEILVVIVGLAAILAAPGWYVTVSVAESTVGRSNLARITTPIGVIAIGFVVGCTLYLRRATGRRTLQ